MYGRNSPLDSYHYTYIQHTLRSPRHQMEKQYLIAMSERVIEPNLLPSKNVLCKLSMMYTKEKNDQGTKLSTIDSEASQALLTPSSKLSLP